MQIRSIYQAIAICALLATPFFAESQSPPTITPAISPITTSVASEGVESVPWPDDLDEAFVVSAPERTPASIPARSTSKTASLVTTRRSRIPASISDGFELRVLYDKVTSMFWVVKRDGRYDLIYANSGGSKSSLSLSSEVFHQLMGSATSFKKNLSDIRSCPKASMQMSIVESGKPEHTVTSCVNGKGPEVERMRTLSRALASIVR